MIKQRGYFQIGPTVGELGALLGIASAILIGIGILIGQLAPIVWGWVKPWLHALTA